MTKLKNALDVKRICVGFECPTKKRSLEKIGELCAGNPKEGQNYFQALVDREKLGSTALGHGVALPHARLEGLEQPVACFLQLEKPIDFNGPDEQGVDLIFGLFVPELGHEMHLALLSHIASLFNESHIRDALRAAKTSEAIFDIFTKPSGDAALAS